MSNARNSSTSLPLIVCCGVAAGLVAGEAAAQAMTPLRVDPTLLGLPPVEKKVPKPAEPVERPRAEVKTVDTQPVETRPLGDETAATAAPEAKPASTSRRSAKASADQIPSRAVAPTAEQPAAVAAPVPQPSPSQSSSPVTAAPAPRPREDEARRAATPSAVGATSAPPARSSTRPRRPEWAAPVAAESSTIAPAAEKKNWFQRAWSPVSDAWDKGSTELYVPMLTYHVRSNYTPEQIAGYEERPPGLGIGRGYYNEKGNWEGIYFLGFQDSHHKPEYHLGYGWKAIWRPAEDVRLGLGLTGFIFLREDILSYKPLPGILPLASVSYKNFSLEGTYVPGSQVFFLYGKWEFGKEGEKIGTPMRPAQAPEPLPGAAGQAPVMGAPRQGGTAAGSYAAGSSGTAASTAAVAGGGRGAVAAPLGMATPPGNVSTLSALRVHPSLLGLPVSSESPYAASAAGVPSGGATVLPVPSPAATVAVLEQSQSERWRAGVAPVLGFSSEPAVLPDDDGASPSLRTAKTLTPLLSSEMPRPMFLAADQIFGINDHETVAEGDVEARKAGMVVNADRMTYWPVEDELEAVGDVVMTKGDDLIAGPKMRMKMEAQTGYFDQPAYFIRKQPKSSSQDSASITNPWASQAGASSPNSPLLRPRATEAHGQATRIDFEGENKFRLFNSDYTTCKPENPGWYVKTEELALDYDRERADGTNGTVYFKDVPIFWTPWMSFSLNNQRKSGFLAPTLGSTSNSGLILATPYYWNIAPNMDAVVAPRVFSKRGVQLASEVRHMSYYSYTQGRLEYMPNDSERNQSRHGYSLQHNHNFGQGFAGALNVSGVSDDNYFTDFSTRSTISSQTQLLRQGALSYGSDWWSATVTGQSYQTLQPDPANPVAKPYSFVPQVNVNARRPDFYQTDLSFLGQYTSFAHPTLDQGRRTVAYPQLALPLVQSGYYVTPKIGVHSTSYSLDRRVSTGTDSISRTLPIASLDAGMTFEREIDWFGAGKGIQTLEPRLFYLNVPYKDQSQIPVFDSGLADFNFAQIFSENQYVGQDRIADANQLTAALTSRLINAASGEEYLRAMVGQRYYFRNQQVTLPGQRLESWNKSDFLAAFSGRVLPKTWVDAAVQYSPQNARVERYSVGGRYQPELGKTLNASYRFNRNTIENFDIAGQWPIWGGWSAVGRYNYSMKDRQPVETVGGLEYNGGCWAVRVVAHQIATVSGKTNSAFYLQLELNDFARIGSNPLDLLKRNIQGYGLTNQPVADPIFGE